MIALDSHLDSKRNYLGSQLSLPDLASFQPSSRPDFKVSQFSLLSPEQVSTVTRLERLLVRLMQNPRDAYIVFEQEYKACNQDGLLKYTPCEGGECQQEGNMIFGSYLIGHYIGAILNSGYPLDVIDDSMKLFIEALDGLSDHIASVSHNSEEFRNSGRRSFPVLFLNYAQVLFLRGDIDGAKHYYERAIQSAYDFGTLHFLFGSVYELVCSYPDNHIVAYVEFAKTLNDRMNAPDGPYGANASEDAQKVGERNTLKLEVMQVIRDIQKELMQTSSERTQKSIQDSVADSLDSTELPCTNREKHRVVIGHLYDTIGRIREQLITANRHNNGGFEAQDAKFLGRAEIMLGKLCRLFFGENIPGEYDKMFSSDFWISPSKPLEGEGSSILNLVPYMDLRFEYMQIFILIFSTIPHVFREGNAQDVLNHPGVSSILGMIGRSIAQMSTGTRDAIYAFLHNSRENNPLVKAFCDLFITSGVFFSEAIASKIAHYTAQAMRGRLGHDDIIYYFGGDINNFCIQCGEHPLFGSLSVGRNTKSMVIFTEPNGMAYVLYYANNFTVPSDIMSEYRTGFLKFIFRLMLVERFPELGKDARLLRSIKEGAIDAGGDSLRILHALEQLKVALNDWTNRDTCLKLLSEITERARRQVDNTGRLVVNAGALGRSEPEVNGLRASSFPQISDSSLGDISSQKRDSQTHRE